MSLVGRVAAAPAVNVADHFDWSAEVAPHAIRDQAPDAAGEVGPSSQVPVDDAICGHSKPLELRYMVIIATGGSPQALRFAFWESSARGKAGASYKRTPPPPPSLRLFFDSLQFLARAAVHTKRRAWGQVNSTIASRRLRKVPVLSHFTLYALEIRATL